MPSPRLFCAAEQDPGAKASGCVWPCVPLSCRFRTGAVPQLGEGDETAALLAVEGITMETVSPRRRTVPRSFVLELEGDDGDELMPLATPTPGSRGTKKRGSDTARKVSQTLSVTGICSSRATSGQARAAW